MKIFNLFHLSIICFLFFNCTGSHYLSIKNSRGGNIRIIKFTIDGEAKFGNVVDAFTTTSSIQIEGNKEHALKGTYEKINVGKANEILESFTYYFAVTGIGTHNWVITLWNGSEDLREQ